MLQSRTTRTERTRTTLFSILVVLVLLAALLLRIHDTDWNKTSFEARFQTKLAGDEVGYDMSVRQWIEKGYYGFIPFEYSNKPNAFTTPVYPMFLMIFYKLFGYGDGANPPIAAIQAAQIALDVLSVWLLYSLAYRILKNRPIALAVMLLYAVHPSFTHLPSYLLTETLYMFITMLFLHALLPLLDPRKPAAPLQGLAAGLVFGLLVLTRPAVAPFAVLFAPYALWQFMRKRIRGRTALLLACGFLLVMAPWWIRNAVSLNKIVLLSEQAGNPLLWGSYPYEDNPQINVQQDPEQMRQMAIDRIRNGFRTEPGLYLRWYTIGKAHILTERVYVGFEIFTMPFLNPWHRMIVYIGSLGLVASFFDKKVRRCLGWIAVFALVSFAVYLPFAPTPRYFVPVLPLVFLGAGYLADGLFRIARRAATR